MDILEQMTARIIKAQEAIIGPLALEQAASIPGLEIKANGEVAINGNKKQNLERLVEKYGNLFGKASIQVCKDSIKNYIDKAPKDQVPDVLL